MLMMRLASFILLASFAAAQPSFASPGGEFSSTWSVSGQTISFAATFATDGWVSIGINNKPTFHSSGDCFVGWIDNNGAAVVIDGYSASVSTPVKDAVQDWTIVSSSASAGQTKMTVSRKINTNNAADDVALINTPQTIFWAISSADGTGNNYPKHDIYGSFTANLLDANSAVGANALPMDPASGIIITVVVPLILVSLFKIAMQYRKKSMRSVQIGFDDGPSNTGMLPYMGGASISYTPKKVDSGGLIFKLQALGRNRISDSQISYKQAFIMLLFLIAGVFWAVLYQPDVYPVELSTGYLCIGAAFLVVIPGTRNSVLVWFLKEPFERTIVYHRWLGRFVFVTGFIHSFFYMYKWFGEGTLQANLKTSKYMYGLFSMISLALLFITSVDYIRRHYYRVFKVMHYSFFGFFIFGALHTSVFSSYAAVAGFLYALDLFLRYAYGLTPQQQIDLHVLPGDVTRVRFPKNLYKEYEAGQYVFLNFPGVNLGEWHPYTLSSGPHQDFLEVHIKALGDHTKNLRKEVMNIGAKGQGHIEKVAKVRVDGPYGNISFNYKRYENLLLIGAGVGVTPLISVVKDLYNIGVSEQNIALHPPSPYLKNVFFMWVVPTADSWSWFFEVLEVVNKVSTMLAEQGYPRITIKGYVTKPGPNFDSLQAAVQGSGKYTVASGRPDMRQVFQGMESLIGPQQKRIAVMSCGPSKLVNQVWDTCQQRTVPGQTRYDFHHEVFDF